MANKHKSKWNVHRQKIDQQLKKAGKKIKELYVGFMLIFSVIGIIAACFFFFIGFHNMDFGQNMKWLNCNYNITLIDQIDHNKYWDASTGYIWGVKQIFTGFFLALWSGFSFGIFLSMLKINEKVLK